MRLVIQVDRDVLAILITYVNVRSRWKDHDQKRYAPRHDKTNKMAVRPAKTQISLGIRPVWSESSLCAQWVAKDPSFLHADSEDSDQTGQMPRLIWVFAGRTLILLVLSCRGSYNLNHVQDVKWERKANINDRIKYNARQAESQEITLADGYHAVYLKQRKENSMSNGKSGENNDNDHKLQQKHRLGRASNKLLGS